MATTLVFLHGMGQGQGDLLGWVDELNDELKKIGVQGLDKRKACAPDYSNLLSGEAYTPTLPMNRPIQPLSQDEWQEAREAFFEANDRISRRVANRRPKAKRIPRKLPSGIRKPVTRFAQSGVARKILPNDMNQVETYFAADQVTRVAIRRVVLDAIDACPADDDVVLVGHSLGSIVAMDAMRHLRRPISGVITVACPARWFSEDLSSLVEHDSTFPYALVRAWVNIYDPLDLVTHWEGINPRIPMALDLPVDVQLARGKRHPMSSYAASQVTATVFAEMVGPPPKSKLSAHWPASVWNPLLLDLSYSARLAGGLDKNRELVLMRARRKYVEHIHQAISNRMKLLRLSTMPPTPDELLNGAITTTSTSELAVLMQVVATISTSPIPRLKLETDRRSDPRKNAVLDLIEALRGSRTPSSRMVCEKLLEAEDRARERLKSGNLLWQRPLSIAARCWVTAPKELQDLGALDDRVHVLSSLCCTLLNDPGLPDALGGFGNRVLVAAALLGEKTIVKELLTDVVTVFDCARELSAYPAFRVDLESVIVGLHEAKASVKVPNSKDFDIEEVQDCLGYFDRAMASLK